MLNINNENWNIKLVSTYHPMLFRDNGSLSVGACDKETRTIYVNENLSTANLKKVLCHEITHAFMISYHILLTRREEELFADLIATYGEEII